MSIQLQPLPAMGPWPSEDPFLFVVHHDDRYPAGNAQLGPLPGTAGRHLGMDFSGRAGWSMYHGRTVPGFPVHPHRGFETVTIVRRGLVDHADSLGAAARYGRGDVQWLTAGDGIQHSEMFPLLERDQPNPLDLFQIWLNLPAAKKRTQPNFTMFWADRIPVRNEGGAEVTVIAGGLEGLRPPNPPPDSYAAQAGADVVIWTLRLAAGATFTVPPRPAGHRLSIYHVSGAAARVDDRQLPPRHVARSTEAQAIALRAGTEPCELLLLGGRPIAEPVAQHGPFVMNSRAELTQAFDDYRRSQFGGWPFGDSAPTHGDDPQRFARHADGRVERPDGRP